MNKTTHQSDGPLIPTHPEAPSRQAIRAQRQEQDLFVNSLRRKLLGLKVTNRPAGAYVSEDSAGRSPRAD